MTYVGALPNEPGAQFRGHLNAAQQDLARMFAGATEPDPKYSYQWWLDTGTSLIKHRNSAGSAWAVAGSFSTDGTVTWYIAGVAPGAAATLKCNFAATAAPVAGDDSGDGYAAGSVWLDTTNSVAWMCRSAAVGAAVWLRMTAAVFAEDTAGLVPGPTAAEIAAGKLLSAGGIWVPREWTVLQTVSPPAAAATIELTSGSPGGYRRLRVRADQLVTSLAAAVTLQLRIGGVWQTAGYAWTGTYVVNGGQVQTGATAAALPLSYSGWAALSDIGGDIDIITEGVKSVIRARGAYTRSEGGRGLYDLDALCAFGAAPDGVRLAASAGTFTATGRVVLEGAVL